MNGVVAGLRALIDRPNDATLAVPWLLVPALILVAIAAALAVGRTSLPALSFARGEAASKLPKGTGHIARVLAFASLIVSALLVSVAIARPQVLGEPEPGTMEGIDIVVALDTSSSMMQPDFGGRSRIDASKRVINDFLGGLKNDRAGIVIFSAEAMVLSPLTLDHLAAQRLVQPLEAGKLLRDGTAIGTGLATALNAVRASTARSKVVVLLTDGQSNTGDIQPLDAAQMAKVLGIRVYTIGAVPFVGGRPGSDVDEALMRRMSELSGGQYYRVGDEAALRNVYREIEALEKARVGSRGFIETRDATLPFVAIGGALLVLELMLATTLFRRTP